MNKWTRSIVAACLYAAPFVALPSAANAGIGDLLVAPTRLVLDGRRGAEIILNNIGDLPATYRVSVEFRRMNENGDLVDVPTPTAADKAAEDMIIYAPRKVTLAPREPQAIRIAARPPQGLPDGEYRVHMLFRAIPPATPVGQPTGETPKGVQFKLTPIYGVTIPVIVRLGNLQAVAGIANVQLEKSAGGPAVGFDITRTGTRSTYGEVRVLKPGMKDPIAFEKGVAVYTEIGTRHVSVPVSDADLETKSLADLVTLAQKMGVEGAPAMRKQELISSILKVRAMGPVTVEYIETTDDGSHLLAQTQAVLR
jgi:P pilus assembly chaperone PapD